MGRAQGPGGEEGRRELGPVRRVVVKLGSALVVSESLGRLIDEMQAVRRGGVEVVIVTSGAVAAGMARLGLGARPAALAEVQALAALGQAALMARYNEGFGRYDTACAQILLTHEDLSHRGHFMNIRHAMEAALRMGFVPVVNENDTVATEELRFGDNDRLAAAISVVVGADLVILLSDVDALYDRDPRGDQGARPIREVGRIDEGIRAMAGAPRSAVGTGGMASKVAAAELAVEAGIPLIVAPGAEVGVLARILAGDAVGTRFLAAERRVGGRRHWIRYLSKVRGALHVDAGAAAALETRGGSLLAVGVRRVEGHFSRGDAVRIVDPEGRELARGLAGYDSETAASLAGRHSHEVAERLGAPAEPLVHRDDLQLVKARESKAAMGGSHPHPSGGPPGDGVDTARANTKMSRPQMGSEEET
ncbi:MAG: glutamate 5-kinase [Deltaproteobacteria bacterium]|nr:glutamate 5-kinase [Deltaproteobacteria bacterium]MCB9785614.1 glutamate 5-kinase [Deltaproteobacteria bacterium]